MQNNINIFQNMWIYVFERNKNVALVTPTGRCYPEGGTIYTVSVSGGTFLPLRFAGNMV